jgi:hypothetical protein
MNRELATAVASIVALASISSAQTLVRTVNGPAANAQYGKACIVVPDQDGDGVKDLLVGAPGFNSQRGAVYCLSGAYLATGAGTQTLWSVAPSANPGDLFGFTIADVGDVTADGVADYLVGQPGYDLVGANDVGVVRLLNGSNHSVGSVIVGAASISDPGAGAKFGSAIAACGDFNGDAKSEVVVGAPGSTSCYMRVLSGSSLTTGGSSIAGTIFSWFGSGGNSALGTAIVSGFDLDGDGFQEVAFSSPGFDGPSGTDTGELDVYEATPSGFHLVGYYVSTIPFERFGQALDAAHDCDGDGVVDIVVGAPNWLDANNQEAGRVVVVSGARLAAGTPPYEIFTLTLPFGSPFFDYHFGAAVRASSDLNNDGVGEILVGAPDYTSIGAGGSIQNKGLVAVFSGATGTRCATIAGSSGDLLGDSTAGAIQDFDGDGFKEFVVAGSLSDVGGTDSGVLKCYRLFPIAPVAYCTGKVNSLGCTPSMSFTGSPKAIPSAPFLINASNIISQKTGLLFYSHSPSSAAFQGGFLCALPPTFRTPVQSSGGSASGSDCTGTYSLDFNARIASGIDSSLVAGAEVFAQYWSRDPQSASTTSLSNALRFVINP